MLTVKKIFISIILFFSLLNSYSYSEVVKKVEVTGNERISLETIKIFGDISIGKNYEISDVNSLIKKLYDTTFFSNISVKITNNILNIVVKENPIINEIELDGEKAKKFRERIFELLLLKENGAFIENNIKSDIFLGPPILNLPNLSRAFLMESSKSMLLLDPPPPHGLLLLPPEPQGLLSLLFLFQFI